MYVNPGFALAHANVNLEMSSEIVLTYILTLQCHSDTIRFLLSPIKKEEENNIQLNKRPNFQSLVIFSLHVPVFAVVVT